MLSDKGINHDYKNHHLEGSPHSHSEFNSYLIRQTGHSGRKICNIDFVLGLSERDCLYVIRIQWVICIAIHSSEEVSDRSGI